MVIMSMRNLSLQTKQTFVNLVTDKPHEKIWIEYNYPSIPTFQFYIKILYLYQIYSHLEWERHIKHYECIIRMEVNIAFSNRKPAQLSWTWWPYRPHPTQLFYDYLMLLYVHHIPKFSLHKAVYLKQYFIKNWLKALRLKEKIQIHI